MKRYDKYKPSGIDWIGDIPEHWTVATVGRVTNLGRGRVISNLEIGENPGEFPVYSSQTENNGVMGHLATYDFDGEYVTWTTDGANAGTVFHRTGKFNCTNVCGTMQPKNWEQLDLRFMPYFLNLGTKYSVRLDINPKLMNNMMAKIPLVIPSIEEQHKIAEFLTVKLIQIDGLIDKKKKLIDYLFQERTALINEILQPKDGWSKKKIKYFSKIISGAAFNSSDFMPTGIVKVLKISNIQHDFINWDDIEYLPDHYADSYKKFRVIDGDIVFALTRPIISTGIKSAMVFIQDETIVLLNQRNAILRTDKTVSSDFMYYVTHSKYFFEMFELSIDNTGQQPNISPLDIGNFEIFYPSLEMQIEITRTIRAEMNRISSTIQKINDEIKLLEEFKLSLIYEIVTGKIKVA